MGRKNEHAGRPVKVRCRECGHEWETISPFPQCSDPNETQESCGRSRNWEFVYKEDDPRSVEYETDRWGAEPENPDHPDHPENQFDEPEPDDESETSPESDSSPEDDESAGQPRAQDNEDDDMVTANEYDSFHGKREPPDKEPDTKPEPEPEPEPEPPKIVQEERAKQPSTFALPDRRTLIALGVGVAVVVAIALYVRKRRKRSGDGANPPAEPEEIEIDPESKDSPQDGEDADAETDPIEEARKIEHRNRNQIGLFED